MSIPIVRHFADFKRLAEDGSDADKEGYVNVDALTGIGVDVQPASPNPAEIATGVFDKKHIMFLPVTASGVREGFRVTVSGLYDGEVNRQMTVDGVEDWSVGPLPHYQLTLSELID